MIPIPSKVKQYLRLFININRVWHTRSGRPKRVFCTDTFKLTIREWRARHVNGSSRQRKNWWRRYPLRALFTIFSVIVGFRNRSHVLNLEENLQQLCLQRLILHICLLMFSTGRRHAISIYLVHTGGHGRGIFSVWAYISSFCLADISWYFCERVKVNMTYFKCTNGNKVQVVLPSGDTVDTWVILPAVIWWNVNDRRFPAKCGWSVVRNELERREIIISNDCHRCWQLVCEPSDWQSKSLFYLLHPLLPVWW